MVTCILFDLGGTLLDFYNPERSARLYARIFNKHGFRVSLSQVRSVREREFLTQMKENYGNAKRHGKQHMLMERVLTALKCSVSDNELQNMAREYGSFMQRFYHLYPGTKSTLLKLKKDRMRFAIVSNGNRAWANDQLERFSIRSLLDAVIVSDDVGKEKSDLVPFEVALKELGVKPGECMMIGDRLDEDMHAKKLGILTCHAAYSYQLPVVGEAIKPDFVIHDIRGLPSVVRKLNSTGRRGK